jgi:capsid assembly protease
VKAFELALSVPWAITEEGLDLVLAVASRTHGIDSEDDLKALEAKLGRPLDNTHAVTYREADDGRKVATLPMHGPMFRHASLFTRLSGATSYDRLATDFQGAMDDPTVKAIVLDVDSPGGDANGTHELASLIHAARGVKPVTAYVGGSGASAAYWIASAAEKVVASKTALVGSIGVVSAMRNKKDPHTVEFVSSVSPRKRPDLATEEGRAEVQRVVDALADVFVEEVASARGVAPARVLSDFGAGGLLVGRSALAAGMVDAIGTYEGVVAGLASARPDPYRRFLDELQGNRRPLVQPGHARQL